MDGININGWFAEDFTLKEIKMLRSKQRFSFRSQKNNNLFLIPTFNETLQLLNKKNNDLNKTIGIYPETKNPTYFKSIGLPLEGELLRNLKENNYQDEKFIFIQSFEKSNLEYLKAKTNIPLVQLISTTSNQPYDQKNKNSTLFYNKMITRRGLKDIKRYADVIGLPKELVVPYKNDFMSLNPTNLVQIAHEEKLKVHIFTFRDESIYLLEDYLQNPLNEYNKFYNLGIDGLFTDFPGTAYQARDLNNYYN